MKRVNDIFYSLQGEGRNTGRAALFVRFAGCNLKCPFCDTDFASYHELSEDYIMAELVVRCMDLGLTEEKPMVVLTGGEPTLQVDEYFVDLLHEEDFYVAMESNGILPAPRNLDWLTVSPKCPHQPPPEGEASPHQPPPEGEASPHQPPPEGEASPHQPPPKGEASPHQPPPEGEAFKGKQPDEIKIIFDGESDPEQILAAYLSRTGFTAPLLYLQPCDTGDAERNRLITDRCVEYIKRHPKWRLSLQTHKLIGIE